MLRNKKGCDTFMVRYINIEIFDVKVELNKFCDTSMLQNNNIVKKFSGTLMLRNQRDTTIHINVEMQTPIIVPCKPSKLFSPQ